jgi:hypothetical protein
MKRKVGTSLDAGLYRQVQEIARRQGRTTNAVIEDALTRFLASGRSGPSMVLETKGTFKVPARALRAASRESLYGTD